MGVTTDSRVAIALNRSLELIVSLVAILKAGGAYVPLDPSYPRERLTAMVEDARPRVLVTSRELLTKLSIEGLSPVVLGEVSLEGQPTHAPPRAALPDSLAYIDFTSGSTGRPKGVGTPQAAVLRTVFGNDYAHLGPDETFLLIAPVSFDASTLELWGPLLHGARLVVFPPHSPSDLKELEAVLTKHGVTTLHLTAGLFTQVVDHNFPALRGVRQLLTGGDVVSAPHVRRVLEELRIPITACYGPTETTLFASTHRMTSVEHVGTSVPIGKPIGNTRVYLLDASGQPVPVGVVGELFIGGDGVARGYVGQPSLTAERFIPDSFSGVPGARLYRTGDLARWRGDGVLEFLGRADAQVKVRGYRIELAEVEAALLAFDNVGQAVALVREDVPGDKRLVGYIAAPESLDVAALRASLKQRLPEYMVPSALVRLDALPLTANAKVDRKALPAPDAAGMSSAETYVAPRNPTEELLAELFAGVLRLPQVSVTGNFFELGGHSLLATQVISRIRATFGMELPLRALFEAPTVAALAQRISAAGAIHHKTAPPLIPVPRTGSLPLSFAQQRLWVIDQLEPGGATYNMPTFVRMEGTLDADALRRALSELASRHEALRTSFPQQEGQPFQLITPHGELPLQLVDLSGLEPQAARAELERRLRDEALRPFNLATGPLVRAQLLKLGTTEHVFALNMHHIVSDGWSMGVLVREVAALYGAFVQGRPSPLPPLPVQYADYAVWQRQWLQGEVLEEQLGYWKQHLSGVATLELPTDRPRPPIQTFNGAYVPVALSRTASEQLHALCQREGTTPFMALLALWQVLLARYSGQDDISVGSPIAGRTRGETEGLIGFFLNTLVLRTQVDRRATFRELLAQVRAITLGAYEHQDVPFEKLVEELRPERSLSHSPLFQVMLVLQNAPTATLEVQQGAEGSTPLKLAPFDSGAQATKFDLTLSLGQTPEGLSGTLRYRTDLFEPGTITRMVEHFSTLVEAAVSAPETRVGELPLLPAAERTLLLESFNATATGPAPHVSVPALFEAQAALHPSRPAVACEGEVLTYAQLDARANQLAWHLRSLGVGADTCVALCLERGVDMVVALLAVWKAGGAYVPMDSAQPALRLQALVQEVAAPVVVTHARHAASFASLPVAVVRLDEDASVLERWSTEAPASAPHPEHLAYVLFTSGSTGRPKGVAVAHGHLLTYVHSVTERLGLAACESFALVSTFAADLGNTVLFPSLCTGGLLHVLTQERVGSPTGVAEYFGKHPIDCVKIVPSHLAALLTAAEPHLVLPRKRLVLGGESSTPAMLQTVRTLAPGCEIHNHYGPTETTVGVLAGLLHGAASGAAPAEATAPRSGDVSASTSSAVAPLGRPLAHTRLYVLDEALQPVPLGVPGELYVGGAQVTRGYLHRPELTAERYLPDAFSPLPGARMYRTGDRVRWLADGRVDFLGRADFQVKVRGFRVEPGEVAAVLREHPSVHEALVVAREDVPGDKRLVAYVTAADGPRPEAEPLRAFLQQRLPAYMVPSAFVVLEALPLTPNGKVDRKALPAPDAAAPRDGYVAPRTPVEEQLASLWADILRMPRVGVSDNFFELGGHSLLATQLVSRIRSTFGVELPLRALFEAPTIAALATRLESGRLTGQTGQAPGLVALSREGALPVSFAQQRLWLIDQLQPGSPAYNMPVFVRMDGLLDVAALQRGFDELVHRHEALRTSFTEQEGQPFQLISPRGELPLEFVDLSSLEPHASRAELERRLRDEALRPFNLATGPLVRAQLLKLGATEHVLALNMHHIVSDGWSMGVLVREVAALYEAFSQGRPSPLPPLPIQYADYAAWQRQWLQGAVLEEQLGYWKQHLSGLATLELPTDKPRPPVQTVNGADVPVALSLTASEQLKALCQQEGATPFMALLAAFQVLLSRYSGQQDITVGSPIAGRQRGELEGLIGFFVNTLVLRTKVEDGASFVHLLRQVKESSLGAYAHQDVPFERLVEELQSTRDMSRSPLFQVIFSLRNTPTASAQGKGLALRPLEVDNPTIKFELQLHLSETPSGYQGALGYNTDLFEPATISRMAEHFRTLVEALAARPEAPLSSVSLLSAVERQQVLRDWSTAASDYPREATLPEVFAQVVARFPENIAVEFGDSRLTYRQLDERSNPLAHHLRRLGVGTDSRVALAVERSLELIVSLVAILKAGGAYVPLDPSYPRERLAGMVEDTRPQALVTTRAFLTRLPADGLATVVLEDAALASEPTHALTPAALPDSLAYVDFTSGSTGRPKGVGTTHRGVLRTFLGVDYARFGPDEVLLQFAPISFDASTLEIWGALLHGARLVVMPPHAASLEELGHVIQSSGVTTMWATSGLFTQLVDTPPPGLLSLKHVMTGGDVVSPAHARRAVEGLRLSVTALYGPTETTVFATSYPVTRVEQVGTSVPIGRPIGSTQLYVLDAHGQPVPVGVIGELYIGGDGLARGYLGQPALTAERFVPDNYSSVPGARLYRTGDLVRWRKDGVLDFVGRADAQVKLRGFRIELAEVEAALLAFPDVAQAVALVREDVPGDKRLVGYVAAPESLDMVALRASLKQRLPEYMVPSALVRLDALPLTANAKVDRKALPLPDAALTSPEDFVAPRTPTEEKLAEMFAAVLRLPQVSVTGNFFELGGHSLLATQLISRIRSTFDVELPLRALFEAPTIAALASRIESGRLTGQPSQAPALVAMSLSRESPLPVSFAQQRLWFIDQLQPGSPAYNMPVFVRMDGLLDVAALQRSFDELVHRHEALRTSFTQQEGQPFQLISPRGELPLDFADLSGLEPHASRAELERRLREEALRPFNLATGPLVRAQLLKLGATEHVLALNMHHIVSDGWSMGVLVREVAALYEAFSQGRPSPLPPLPIQYADYAAWQRQWLQGAVLDEQLGYWKQHLSGLATLELPTDKPRPPVQTFNGADVPVALSLAVSEQLKSLCQQEGATPFMALLAAFQVLLSRYSGQQDITVGSPIAGRQRGELEGLIGFFVNTLVLRAKVEDGASFVHLLRQVKESSLGAYAHQDVPFERLVEELQSTRDMSRGPLFQVLFSLVNTPAASAQGKGLALRPLDVEKPIIKFELQLTLSETQGGYQGVLGYNTDLFEHATALRMASHFQVLVEALAAHPEARLSELPLMDAAEQRQVLREWNATASDYPRESTLPEVFSQVVARFPDHIAVEFGSSSLTYRQLDERSNLLAHHLRSLGVGADSRVALAVERSMELIISLVAILKAGGAYVPLDPSYPRERLAGMVEDTRPQALVTTRALLPRLPVEGLTTVVLEDAALASEPTHALTPAALPDSLAYVDFTSGSTGRPKGVGTTHRNVLRTLLGVDFAWFGPNETLLQLAPISFDASTLEIWGALLHGARLVVMPPQPPSLEELGQVLRDSKVTTLWLTAGLFTQVVESHLQSLSPVKQLLSGGDVVPPAHARRVLEELGISLTNGYGPTETTVFAACFRMTDPTQVGTSVPIGRPIGSTRLYVLDAHGQPVPAGIVGELFIGGDGVARGYIGQPALTAERFVPDAYSGVPGARLYRTGDLVRWRGDGVLDFVGRADAQVKLRGFRIELGEVEAALLAFPDVAQAVALVREDAPGDKRLVGYVSAPESLDMVALRSALKQRLPEYMVPSALVRLDALPLTANAKVDRKALPAPDAVQASPTEAFVAPRTPLEEKLAEVFAAVLRLPQVSITGNFFELGGHSLLATQVISRIRSELGVELPLRALFEASTVDTLAEHIESTRLSGGSPQAPALLRRAASSDTLPLSFAQQRLWFIDQLQPGSSAYNMPSPVRLTGTLDVSALERSLGALVERHESLRTTFAASNGEPVQVIHPVSDFRLPLVDLGALPTDERETEAQRLATEDGVRPFDLSRGPLFRASLLRLAPDEHVLLLNLHHIISDGWSLGILVRELAALYEAHASGRTPQLTPLPMQYADYSVWQRSWLSGEVLEAQLGYWKKQLESAPRALELPTDRPRPPVQTFRGETHPFELPTELGQQLEVLARQNHATLFMVLLAAWQTLLSRYSGQDDVVVGSPIAGRNRTETEGLIGFFVNSLALRARVLDEDTFASLLGRVRESTLGAYAHQEVPFEKLVEVLQHERDLSRSPLFQVMFSLQNLPDSSISLPGLKLSTVETPTHVSKFELTLTMTPSPQGLYGSLSYNTDLFDASTIARMAGHLRTLLEAIAANPRQRLSDVQLMREEERRQVIELWNDTSVPLAEGARFHELFEAQSQRTPDAPALRFGERTMSYRELDTRANRLAHELRARGVRPDTRVALCLERSFDVVVGLLGVLKAGGAYVPMDPAYPRERLDFMLQDCGAPVLLTHSHLRDTLPSFSGDVLTLDTVESVLSRHPATAPARVGTADDLAYIIYTSGSTGRPKGVMVSHRGVPNLAADVARVTGLRPGQRVLQFASFSFDAAVYEVTLALQHGATLVLASREDLMPGQPLVDVLRGQAIDQVLLPPSVLALLPTEGLETLGTLISGGEACTAELVEKWAPGRQFINAYGPTEATVIANLHVCVPDGQRPPLGQGIANTRQYVLDRHLRPVPVGVAGELCIGGVGLARGYLNRPELTAEKFVPDAFGTEPGGRLYRTGDLVRWRADGTLEYLGRIDFQVKLRGFRIELGEIEAVLASHSGVRQALVLVREDRPGDKRLVAYAVPAPGVSLDAEALRATVKQRLPEHMVPSAYVVLDTLPLTPNGKVDRKALPVPEAPASTTEHIAPRTPTEELLAGLWGQVLGLERVGADAQFFELGGHSLLATQVISRIRSTFGVELPLRALFEAPTVATLARRVDAAVHSRTVQAPPLVPVPRTGELPLSFAQQRLWFIDQLQPGSSAYNIPTALRMRGPLDVGALEKAFISLAERHEALRTTFGVQDGEPVQVIHPLPHFPLPVVDLSTLPAAECEAEARRLATQEAQRPFDLARGPVFRALLLRLGEQDHVLIGTMHHIVSDGWSMGVLVRELAELYAAHSLGREPRLPALPVQYADFAAWQRSWLRGDALEKQLEYWRQQLSGAAPVLELPTDKPRPAVQSHRGAVQPVQLSASVSEALLALCQREGTTPFMALLALWQVMMSRYSGQDDISVGSPIAGRTRGETEGLIGFFVNTLVLRTQVDARATFRELLAKVRATTLGAYEHQDVPFEKLVEELRPQRSLSHSPLFQVMLVLQNAPTTTLEVKGRAQDSTPLRLEPFESGAQTTKFDLTLSLTQRSEGFGGALSYRTDLFEPGTITRMVEHFTTLVEAAVSAPETRVGELPLLPASERQQVLVRWNDTRQESGWDGALHERFEAQAARTPDAVAVLDDSASLSFAQVNRRANQLARWLRSRGVGPEVRVALCMERGVDMVVAVIGILKAGGAYVPMDPAYPRERLAFMLQDCGARLALTQRHLSERMEGSGVEALYLDDAAVSEQLARESEANPPRVTSPEHLAYVIYTSGSTGRPKGVMVQHASVMNLRAALASAVYAGAGSALRVSLNAPLAFDASVKQLIQVADGHALCVVPQAAREDVAMLKAWVEKHQLDVLDCSPSHLRLLLEEGLAASRPLHVLVGGEAVDEALWAKLSAHPFIQCFNVYGPTECTVDTTARAIRGASRPTLGGPLANVQVYVLDEHMQPVPTGVPGELFIGGAGVARGYLGRPELSAEKFIPDPFGTTAGGRLYRTGDKVRWLANGELDYLGRIDFQVKLRGFRIELGEIETALEQDASVSRAVVLAREDIPGNPRLVAYLVTPEGRTLDTAELRASLLRSLPEYMVPSAFVFLAALPLNTHGKVDRKALPTPDASSTGAAYVAPRTPTEEAVAAVWAEVLHVEKVGATDDFFALGGHSLLAVRLMARLRERTGVALPVSALFQGATVERLAQRLEQRDDASRSTSNLVRLDAGTATGRPLFLVHGGGGSVLGYTELVRHLSTEKPIYGLSASGIDGGELPAASIEVLARDYLAQLRAVQPQGPYLLGGWSFGGLVAYEMARLLQAAGEQVELLALLDSHAPDAQPRPEPDALMQLAGFGRVLGLPWQSLPLDVEHLRRLDVRGALAYVLEQARRSPSGGLALDLDAAERLFRVYQRLSHAQRTYVPAGAYTGPAVLLRAATPPSGAPRAQDLGWSAWIPGALTVHEVPGDHFTLLTAPHVTSVVERLDHHLRLLERDAT